jgi:hypothetical protein
MIKLIDILLELSGTDHFLDRIRERGNVLDILNLNEIPLKDYKPSEVKEKLKTNISEEISKRAKNLLNKDIASSDSHNIGIKLLKPVLKIDRQRYPLVLFAMSTKEIKDKEGNIIGTREVENKGTLYFAIIYGNKVRTLLLLNKEDNNDLYFQIKDHADNNNLSKESKIIAPSDFVYEIDLDELMGNKVDQEVTLIDPTTLDYTLRTDYRKGANFTHKKHGTGKIINTSSGSGGEGDSRGELDWVEVDFGKPILKGGKLIPYRRIEGILTLVSPKLKK